VECETSERARVLGCEIDRVDFEHALHICERAIESRHFVQHMAVNAKLLTMRRTQLASRRRSAANLSTGNDRASL